jgi:hypothetical protein
MLAAGEETTMNGTNAKRIVSEGTMHLSAAPERVFPLLCPVREHEWIDTWRADIVYSDTGIAEKGCVFTTADTTALTTVWTVSRYEPAAGIIEFVMVTPGLFVTTLAITLEPAGDGTRAFWRRTFTALSPSGERAMAPLAAQAPARLGRLEAQLDHYLRTGSMLRS